MEQAQNNSSPSRNELQKVAKAQAGSPLHLALLKYLGDEQDKIGNALQRSDNPVEIYRHQGDLGRIDRLVSLLKVQ
jgi:hypothetical protein